MMLWEYMRLIREGKPEQAETLRQSTIPSKLVKFVWLDGAAADKKKLKTLANNEIWVSARRYLNDPYEFKGLVLDRQKLVDAKYPEQHIDKYEELFDFDDYGVACLSANPVDYLPMWAYYTNNHQGYCIEYEVLKKGCVHEVLYEEQRVKVASLLFQSMDAAKDAMRKGRRTPEADFFGRLLLQNLYMKDSSWQHEREYRVVFPIGTEAGKSVPVTTFGLIPSRIIAGISCSPENYDRLNAISCELGLGGAYKCSVSDCKYGVDIIS